MTARISGFKRAPSQAEQGARFIKARIRLRVNSLSVSRIESLQLREQSLEWSRRLRRAAAIPAEAHLDRAIARSEVERFLEFLGQILERDVIRDIEMPHQRGLQPAVIGLHPFRPAPPRHDRAFGE